MVEQPEVGVAREPLRIILACTAVYTTNLTGANKINRLLMEQLAERGHACMVIALERPIIAISQAEQALFSGVSEREGVYESELNGVTVRQHAIAHAGELTSVQQDLSEQIAAHRADWILVSSEDWGQLLLRAAIESAADRTIYLAHTPLALPFGPEALLANETTTELLRRTAGIIALSEFLSSYIREWGEIAATTVYPQAYGAGPFPEYDNTDRGYVMMINPCAVKGISIFAGLAKRFPDTAFAAVLSWGTTPGDRALLEQHPNITLIDPTDDIESFYSQARVLLAPSLWHEAFGLVVVEALVRGIPVLASAIGGLPEAKLGTEGLIPVTPIDRFVPNNTAIAESVPEQDLAPWEAQLRLLLDDQAHYRAIAEAGRATAIQFIEGLSVAHYETEFERLRHVREQQAEALNQRIAELSPQRRKLLELLQSRKQQENS